MNLAFTRNTALLFLALAVSAPVFGSTLSGTVNTVGSVDITTGVIALNSLLGVPNVFTVGVPDSGTFAGLAGSQGTVQNLTLATEPVNTPLNVPNFITFAALPNISFTLTELVGGTFGSAQCAAPPSPGQTCTPDVPALSPFDLTNQTAHSSIASFEVMGIAVDSSTGMMSNFVGTFSTQFTDQNYQQLIATVAGGGTVSATYSANFIVTATPEPHSQLLMLSGGILMIGLSFAGRKFLRS